MCFLVLTRYSCKLLGTKEKKDQQDYWALLSPWKELDCYSMMAMLLLIWWVHWNHRNLILLNPKGQVCHHLALSRNYQNNLPNHLFLVSNQSHQIHHHHFLLAELQVESIRFFPLLDHHHVIPWYLYQHCRSHHYLTHNFLWWSAHTSRDLLFLIQHC